MRFIRSSIDCVVRSLNSNIIIFLICFASLLTCFTLNCIRRSAIHRCVCEYIYVCVPSPNAQTFEQIIEIRQPMVRVAGQRWSVVAPDGDSRSRTTSIVTVTAAVVLFALHASLEMG